MIGRPPNPNHHVGERFGRLIISGRVTTKSSDGHALFLCKCDCGKAKTVRYDHLKRNERRSIVSSCGCWQTEVMRIRGERYRMENHPQWKGGSLVSQGYRIIRVESKKRMREHRAIWEKVNGPIPKGFVIHHLNGNKLDNRIENLSCLPLKSHHGRKAFEPYEKRIKELELKLKEATR